MSQGPVPPGRSTKNEDAKIATDAAQKEETIAGRAQQDDKTASRAAPDDGPPPWLDLDAPPDPGGDERDWLGNAAAHAAQAEIAQTEEAVIRERLLAAGVETGYAHWQGAPRIPGIRQGPAGGFGQSEP